MTREDFDAITELGKQIRKQVAAEEAAAARQIRNAVLYGYARSLAVVASLWLLATIAGS